ncbi:hypothetical protein CSUI_003807 [Cystoisospora suis]|uniref:Transmembrane protein n=1 Tax=Cystoisospora suis TaxID=483139 RepID=A0A2C6L464_9APIC|nr:hypothetical protein CSUI_003807 [Cystoisospora suis]
MTVPSRCASLFLSFGRGPTGLYGSPFLGGPRVFSPTANRQGTLISQAFRTKECFRACPPPMSSKKGVVFFSRTFSSVTEMDSGKSSSAPATIKHEPANAYPETPLHFYRATPYSEGSINHRFFYINLVFLLFVYDVGSAMIDL